MGIGDTGDVFSVEILPAVEIDDAVRSDWAALIDAGLPSAGRHPSESNRPHVTVAVRDELDPSAVAPLADLLPVDCALGGAVVFAAGERFVLARPVVMTRRLLDLHAAAVELVGPPPAHYAVTAVDRWTPHVTLARRMTAEQIGQALALVGAESVAGAITGLRVWDAAAREVTTLR